MRTTNVPVGDSSELQGEPVDGVARLGTHSKIATRKSKFGSFARSHMELNSLENYAIISGDKFIRL